MGPQECDLTKISKLVGVSGQIRIVKNKTKYEIEMNIYNVVDTKL